MLKKIIYFLKNDPKRLLIILLAKIAPIFPDKLYLKLLYRISTGRKLDLKKPQTYNEKLQWLKLYNRRKEYSKYVDKYEVKKYIANVLGEEYVIPNIGVWDNFDEIDFTKLPEKFVLKCTHDSGGLIVCRDKNSLDISKAKEKIDKAMSRNYYTRSKEYPYKHVMPRIIAEEYMEDVSYSMDIHEPTNKTCDVAYLQNKHGLLDYKFMCFDGVVKALFLDIGVIGNSEGHSDEYYRSIFDRDFNVMPFKETRDHYPIPINRPHFFEEMVKIAEILSQGFPHIRVDLYYINGQIKVGELTFFHGSGLSNHFIPEEWNYKFGEWIKLPQKYNVI